LGVRGRNQERSAVDALNHESQHPVLASALLRFCLGYGVRAALERFDWRAAAALRKKNHRKWDAIQQLIRYRDVVGCDTPISAQTLQSGELFVKPVRSEKS
jgi:hypothetical protein